MIRRAPLMFLGSATLFGCMAFAAKLATRRLNGAEVAMIRFAIAILPVLVVPSFRRSAMRYQRVDLLLYRGVFGGLAVLLYFLAIQHVAVGVATLLNYTAPLFSGVFAALFIGERIRARVAFPLAVAFTGLVLVVRAHGDSGPLGFGTWEIVGLCSAVLSGGAVTAIRIARRTETSWSVYASFTIFGILCTAPFAFWSWSNPTAEEWLYLAAVGVFSIGAQLIMTHAFRWVETLIAGVISQFAVVVSMTLGALLLGDRITPLIALGTILTISGVVMVMYVSTPRAAPGEQPAVE